MERLDVILVNLGLCESRSKAKNIIESGKVFVNDSKSTKCSQKFDESVSIEIEQDAMKYVSRGGLKLEKALEVFNIDLAGETVLDIGSSTGGFCDCALKFGAKCVIAVDVGINQLHKSLRNNKKVISFEGTDIRKFDLPSKLKPTILVGDLSFISIAKILPCIVQFHSIEIFCMLVKPQFECGFEIAKKHKGVIRDLSVHKNVLQNVWNEFEKYNLIVTDLTTSPISGGDGNFEYLILARRRKENMEQMSQEERSKKINDAVEEIEQKRIGENNKCLKN